MRLRSFKLHFFDEHVWIMPAVEVDGSPFAGTGVDLRGEAARDAFSLAAPMLDVLRSYEPGLDLRALSLDLERERLLATTRTTVPLASRGGERPRVVRIDRGPAFDAVRAAAGALVEHLSEIARRKLEARRA